MFRREPVGVVGQIAPWNYPLLMAVWKLGPALAAGCTVVLKPAPTTPLSTLLLADLLQEAGIPAGVVNIVTGGNDTGQAIVEHPDVRMVSLTGSTGTGKKIMATAADSLKRVHLELGGKAPVIVFDDADLELVAAKASFAAICNTGQDCTAATRVYVEKALYADAVEALVAAMRGVQVGDPFDDNTAMGPVISAVQRQRVLGFIERAKAGGARVLTGGGVPKGYDDGFWVEPTVIVDADQQRRDHPERGLWAGAHHQRVRRRGAGRGLRQRRALRAGGFGLHQGRGPRHAHRPAVGVRHGLDQRPYPAGLGRAARRLQAVGLWQGSVAPRRWAITRSPSTS